MVYIEKIKIINNAYPGSHVLKKDFVINCSHVNLFVGDQGCGKSTLLNLIQKNHNDINVILSDFALKNEIETFFFDSEKDNPRINDPQHYTNSNGENIGIGFGAGLASRFKSHGEILESFIIRPLLKAKDCVIILDEPESGLSITNQFKLINAINVAVDNGCQLFIATHCYPLITSFDVISLEHNEQMNGNDFIKNLNKI
jgi:predicted ATPase